MPGLSSFCITAAVCIGFIFVLQVSWTVAWLAVDQRRIENNLHGIFPWIQLSDNNNSTAASVTSQKIWREKFVHFYADLFKYWPFKVGNIKKFARIKSSVFWFRFWCWLSLELCCRLVFMVLFTSSRDLILIECCPKTATSVNGSKYNKITTLNTDSKFG